MTDTTQGEPASSEAVARRCFLIQQAPIGSYIGAEGARILAEHASSEVCLKVNEYLLRKGEPNTSFFLIASGKLARVRENGRCDGKPQIVHVLQEGDLVGELSFIDGTPPTLSVMALGESTLVQFDSEDFQPLISEHPQLMFDFMRAVVKRVHHTLTDIATQQTALADYISSGGKGRQ